MREIKTLEVDRWEPSDKPGMVKHVGMISPQEAFDALEAHLEKEGLMPDEYFQANHWAWKDVKELPNYHKAACSLNWGGNEGIYLEIELIYQDEKHELQRLPFATGKTLGQSGDDYLKMSRIGAECSMMLNGRGEMVRFYEEEKEMEKPSVVEKAALYDKACEKMNEFAEYMEGMEGFVHIRVRKAFQKFLEECGMLPEKNKSLNKKIEEKKFNPFYDSEFLISREKEPEQRRMLVELYESDLVQLRNEIDMVLEGMTAHKGVSLTAERENEEKASLEEKIEGASARIQNGDKKDNLPGRVIQEGKEL